MRQDKFETHPPRSATDIARDSGNPMGRLLSKARQIEHINLALLQVLGHELRGRFSAVPPENGSLCIVVTDAATATRLKMATQEILKNASESLGTPVNQLNIRVDPQLRPQPRTGL